jgi:hypothetical protein
MNKIILAISLVFLISCKGSDRNDILPSGFSYAKLPALKKLDDAKTYTLRVLRVYDNRLKDLTEGEYKKLYIQIEKDVKDYVGFKIKIVTAGKENILAFFKDFAKYFNTPQAKKEILSDYIDVSTKKGRNTLLGTISDVITKHGKNILKYLPKGIEYDKAIIMEYLYSNFLTNYNGIINSKTLSGKTLYNPAYKLTLSYLHWTVIAHHIKNADIVITNTMIVSADKGMPLYVIRRGGVTSAFVEDNLNNSPLNAACILGLRPFISNDAFFYKIRGKISGDYAYKIPSMIVAHEMGHMLRRYVESYNETDGVHMAAKTLNYFPWYKRILKMKNLHPIKSLKTLRNF